MDTSSDSGDEESNDSEDEEDNGGSGQICKSTVCYCVLRSVGKMALILSLFFTHYKGVRI